MNSPTHDQALSGQSSALPPASSITASDAARIMAQRRTELRQEAATQAATGAPKVPTEDAAGEQPLSGDSLGADGQQVTTDTDSASSQNSPGEQSAEGEEGVVEYVLLDGEEIPLNQLKDWREGSMRQEDYSRKTQVLAQQTQAISAMELRINSFAHAMNKQFMAAQQEQAAGLSKYQKIDWVKLAQQDPARYSAAKAAFDAEQTQFRDKQNQWSGFLQEFDSVSKETLAMRAQASLPEIKARIKGWNDGTYAELSDFAVTRYGFSREMVNKITDPQFWEMAHDANNYAKGKAVKTTPAKVIRGPKTVLRTTAGVSATDARLSASNNQMDIARQSSGAVQMAALADVLKSRRGLR